MINKNILALGILCTLLSCKNDRINDNEISIPLEITENKSIAFSNLYSSPMASSLYKQYPKFYNSQLQYKNIPRVDSLIISTMILDYRKFKYDLYNLGFVDSLAFKSSRLDSLVEKKKPTLSPLAIVTYFKDGQQKVIYDENNNKDFSDDLVLSFDEKFYLEVKDQRIYNNLPIQHLEVRLNINDSVIFQNRRVIIYPSAYSYYNNILSNDKIINKSRIHFKFKDYWKGNFTYEDNNFDVAIQGVYPYLNFLIKSDSLTFSETDSDYNSNFSYTINDTIQLNNEFFILDTISSKMTMLKLKKLDTLKEFSTFRS